MAAYAARWGGTGRAPSNPPALGLGFDAWGHSRETRELAGAVGEGATPCTDGRPPENTPAWIASHQSSLPNAAKGYPPREPRETFSRKSKTAKASSDSERWRISGERQRFLQVHSTIVARRNAAIFDFNAWPKMGGEMPRAPREQYE